VFLAASFLCCCLCAWAGYASGEKKQIIGNTKIYYQKTITKNMEKIKDAIAVVGEYNKGGEIKKRYQKVGSLFQRDDGSFSMKLESLPLSADWNGWLNFYDPYGQRKDQEQQQVAAQPQQPQQPPQQSQRPIANNSTSYSQDMVANGDEIPF
tara:strand:- start:3051 stop:3506 length:456 start_codon:yes stop_codon:yes gene_type:complete